MDNNDKLINDALFAYLNVDNLSQDWRDRLDICIEYLADNDLQAFSNDVPSEFLDWWLDEWNTDSIPNVDPDCGHLSIFVRIFAYVILMRCKEAPEYFPDGFHIDTQSALHAAELAQYIRTARIKGIAIPDFDIFDIFHYDEIMEELFGNDRNQPTVS